MIGKSKFQEEINESNKNILNQLRINGVILSLDEAEKILPDNDTIKNKKRYFLGETSYDDI